MEGWGGRVTEQKEEKGGAGEGVKGGQREEPEGGGGGEENPHSTKTLHNMQGESEGLPHGTVA
jgi:hypothetical protein